MSEYWKSTPKYWCKHCSVYVRDSKLERQNHESTAKHQSAVKRTLRDLHRGHEREERDKERAKREIDRLNGVVTSGPSSSSVSSSRQGAYESGGGGAGKAATEAERKRQMEQLAAMGVSIPDQFRGDMAMVGEWTVTNTRVINNDDEKSGANVQAKALGVRKHERTEEQVEEENAVNSLFKKPRRWGRDSRAVGEDDADLDALLSGSLVKKEPKAEKEDDVKQEEDIENKADDTITSKSEGLTIKKEPSEEEGVPEEPTKDQPPTASSATQVREENEATPEPISVTFKKRKPKTIRQR